MSNTYSKIAITALMVCTALAAAFGESHDKAQTPAQPPSDSSFFVDPRDGKRYRTVKIGKQTWMAYNLNYKMGKSWCYNDDNARCKKYGRLYDWNTAMKACPEGWRLPTLEDWRSLAMAVGGRLDNNGAYWHGVGRKLKARSAWDYETYYYTRGTDSYEFSALPSGGRDIDGDYFNATGDGQGGYWWTATENGGINAYRIVLFNHEDGMLEEKYGNNGDGYSVRCLQKVVR